MDSASSTWRVEPEQTANEAVAQVETALALGFPDPVTPLQHYQAMMSHGDESCPGDATQIMDNRVPREGCTAESGYFFSGVAAYTETDSLTSSDQTWGFHLDAGFLLIDDQGLEYEAGGNLIYSLEESLTSANRKWIGQVTGSWIHAGGPLWLDTGISASLSLGGSEQDGERTQNVTGTLGISDSWISMDALTWDSSCEDQPHGVIGIRDTSGLWLWTELEADCSGCGISTWDGSSESEELCIDLRSIKTTLDFLEEVDPWS